MERVAGCSFDLEDTEISLEEEVIKLLEEYKSTDAELFTAIKNGFWLACSSGPLANEQMMGVVFILESIKAVHEPKPDIKEEKKHEEKKTETASEAR